jgi:uncharacterized DUF497 family protein
VKRAFRCKSEVDGERRPISYIFEWSQEKISQSNSEAGITFDEASTVFGDPLALLMPDPDHSEGEERYLLLGMSTRQRLPVVGFAERPPRTRLS